MVPAKVQVFRFEVHLEKPLFWLIGSLKAKLFVSQHPGFEGDRSGSKGTCRQKAN